MGLDAFPDKSKPYEPRKEYFSISQRDDEDVSKDSLRSFSSHTDDKLYNPAVLSIQAQIMQHYLSREGMFV